MNLQLWKVRHAKSPQDQKTPKKALTKIIRQK